LTATNQELLSLRSLDDCANFARKLRGQFTIIVRHADAVFALTDFAGSLPVYYTSSGGGYHIATRLAELRRHCNGEISRAGTYFFAARGSVGIDPLYAGVKQVLPGTVIRFSKEGIQQIRYVDWHEMGGEQ